MAEISGTIYDFSALSLDGEGVSLARFRGKVVLIADTASQCGFTPQYAGLEKLYRSFRDRDFAVLAFPCNQFGAQEPGSASEIGSFCRQKYEVSFPIFAKIDVNGEQAHPLYRFLKASRPGIFGTERIKWNFTKFLVDRAGRVVRRYAPRTRPASIVPAIEQLLDPR